MRYELIMVKADDRLVTVGGAEGITEAIEKAVKIADERQDSVSIYLGEQWVQDVHPDEGA